MRIIKDKQLLRQVKALFTFRNHVTLYVVAVLLMWCIWFISGGRTRMLDWPLYIAMGWGSVLLVHFIIVYRKFRNKKIQIKNTNKAV